MGDLIEGTWGMKIRLRGSRKGPGGLGIKGVGAVVG
jgi:hypothetical protein